MERLTTRTPKGAALKMNGTYPNEVAARSDLMRRYLIAVERLAAYEDTDLDPEEVKEFLDDVESRFILWISKEYGISAGRHIDIMQAEKEGRLVILPKESPNAHP